MDRLFAVFAELPEKHFRTVVLVALALLLSLELKVQIDLAVLKQDQVWYHGQKP